MKNIIIVLFLSFATFTAFAQTKKGNGPYVWPNTRNEVATIQLPAVNVDRLLIEDAENERLKIGPWRFGQNFDVNYHLNNSGTWTSFGNQDRLWQINIVGTKALSLNFIFNNFNLPPGAELYIYSPTTQQHIGAYTALNNNQAQVLGSDLLIGNEAMIQLYVPAHVSFEPSLSIATITHGYKSVGAYVQQIGRGLNDSGDCNVDVNCPLGTGWENQIRAVAMIVVNGNGACTGTLINNTKKDGTPYFLTANHCGTAVANWSFRFNWESPTPSCATTTGSAPDNEYDTMNGATLIANNSKSDVNLVKFNNDIPLSYNVYYAGWDKSDIMSGPSTGIHHPNGDIKKISRENETVHHNTIDFNGNSTTQMWQVDDWDQGVTEPGSSGSALFDAKGRIIGQLAGGYAQCSGTSDNNTEDWYGRFAVSWDFGSTPETRLKDWLDPLNINVDTLGGFDPNQSKYATDIRLHSISGLKANNCETTLTGDLTPVVKITNQGSDTIHSFKLFYRLDNLVVDSIVFENENWFPLTFMEVTMPSFSKSLGDHTYLAYLAEPNGIEDENHLNDTSKISFKEEEGNAFNLKLALDYYPTETSWSLKNDEDVIIDAGNNYTQMETISNDYCLADDCYSFNIFDSGSNGLEGFFGIYFTGSFQGSDNKGDTIFYLHPDTLNFGSQTTRSFCFPSKVGIDESLNTNAAIIYPNPTSDNIIIATSNSDLKQIELYAITGKLLQRFESYDSNIEFNLTAVTPGTYLLKIKLNETLIIKKVQKIN